MKITKAKLVKGTYLEVEFSDGNAVVAKSYPHTEAPPKLLKAFMSLNHHLCDLTEQYDTSGQGDYDNIAARGYSMKGEGEKEGVTITGVRTLQSGRSITLNSPFVSMDIFEGTYPGTKALVDCLDRCRDAISSFMDNNKSEEEIQGKLFDTSNSTFIVKSEHTEKVEQETAVGIVFRDVIDNIEKNAELSDEEIQNELDEEMPVTQEMIQKNNARKNSRKKKD